MAKSSISFIYIVVSLQNIMDVSLNFTLLFFLANQHSHLERHQSCTVSLYYLSIPNLTNLT